MQRLIASVSPHGQHVLEQEAVSSFALTVSHAMMSHTGAERLSSASKGKI